MIRIGIIGCGYWGPNLLRNFGGLSDCIVTMVADHDVDRREYVRAKYPDIGITADYTAMWDQVDAMVIATPPSTHYALAKEALQQGKHVLVEKPLAMTTGHAQELLELATQYNCRLMVGHTFEYNAAVQELKKQIDQGTIGAPYYFYAQRLNFGIVRQDVNALWNLAPHDISILLYLMGQMPVKVSARGLKCIQAHLEDVVFMTLTFPKNVVAHVQVSWLDPNKVRRMTVVGSEKMIVYDDMADAKIQIFDKGIKKQNITDSLGAYDDFGQYQLIRSAGDVTFPKIDFKEPLQSECAHFIKSITQGTEPQTDGHNGLRVVQVLEAAQHSMQQDGQNMDIEAAWVMPT